MGKKLAIRGHSINGNKVIELLEMMGGSNIHTHLGNNDETFYYIDSKINVDCDWTLWNSNRYAIFTLEEFLEKYPFKVGDKVRIPEYESEVRICKMEWDGFEIQYKVYRNDDEEWYTATDLKNWNDDFYDVETKVESPVRDREDILFDSIIWHLRNSVNNGKHHLSGGDCETYFRELVKKVKVNDMESCKCPESEDTKKVAYLSINNKEYADEIEINLGDDYEYKFEMNRLYIIKKKHVYPKTYGECCDVLGYDPCENEINCYKSGLIDSFVRLLVCRDAYWKIAGEQMGLGKPWEPDLENEELYCIQNYNKQITISRTNTAFNKILIFPTEEMRDTFYENKKDLIEKCKELL